MLQLGFRTRPLPCLAIMKLLRNLALCAFFVPAAIVAGCGDEGGIPGNAVAEVDGTAIERADYDHWLNVAAKSSGAPNAAVPKPPEFTECVAAAKKTQAKPAEGQPKLTDQQLKDQCKQQYEQLRDQVLGLLISFEWIEREAADQGGKVPAVAKGQQEKAFDDAIFAADKGKITGPVKTQFGFYVFKVDKIVEASQQTRDEAKETIKQLLASQNQQKALDAYVKDFRKRWKEQTDCREGFVTQDCKNAPKPTPTPTTAAPAPAPPPEQ